MSCGHLPKPVPVADQQRPVQPQVGIDALPLGRGELIHLPSVDGGGRVTGSRVDEGKGKAAHNQQNDHAL